MTSTVTSSSQWSSIDEWQVDDVKKWADSVGMSDFSKFIQDHKINGKLLKELTNEELLIACGLENKVHRLLFIAKINQLLGTSPKRKRESDSDSDEDMLQKKRRTESKEPDIVPDEKFGVWMAKVTEAAKNGKPISSKIINADVEKRVNRAFESLDIMKKADPRTCVYGYPFNKAYYEKAAEAAKEGRSSVRLSFDQIGVVSDPDRYAFNNSSGQYENYTFFKSHGVKFSVGAGCDCKFRLCDHHFVEFSWPFNEKE
jgi:hypothetical protein